MSALGLPGYHLHAAYAGDWQLSPAEVSSPHTRVISLKAHPDLRSRGGGKRVLWGKAHPGLGTRGGGVGVCYREESAGHLPLCFLRRERVGETFG